MDIVNHDHVDDGVCVQRDPAGNLRTECGTGLIIATPFDDADRLRDWLSTVTPGQSYANYEAALRFLAAEEASRVERRPRPALAIGLRAASAHRKLVTLRAELSETGDRPDLVERLTDVIADLEG